LTSYPISVSTNVTQPNGLDHYLQ